MNNDLRSGPGTDPLSDQDLIGELIHRAGSRASSDAYRLSAFKEEALARWQAVVERRRRRVWRRRFAYSALAAAAAFGAATLALRLVVTPAAPRAVGSVELVVDELRGDLAGEVGPLAAGDSIPAAAALSTGAAGRAALRLESGIRVRLDRDSEVRLASSSRLELERGSIYVDASGAPDAAYLDVATHLGVVRDIGTVYQVGRQESGVAIRVREGRVAVQNGRERHEAEAGTKLTLAPDGTVEASETAIYGPDWAWALEASPAFELEGATLGGFLDWLTRETGLFIRFSGGDPESLGRVILHGSLEGVPPEQTPDIVLPGCGLSYRREDGALVLTPVDESLPFSPARSES